MIIFTVAYSLWHNSMVTMLYIWIEIYFKKLVNNFGPAEIVLTQICFGYTIENQYFNKFAYMHIWLLSLPFEVSIFNPDFF